MKYTVKYGFTLIEVIFTLWITLLSLFLITSSLSLLKELKFKFYLNEDANFINQIQLLYALGENKQVENGMLSFIYDYEEMYFELYDQKLILKEGYQVFLNDIKDAYFEEKEGCTYLYYERDEWNEAVVGCS